MAAIANIHHLASTTVKPLHSSSELGNLELHEIQGLGGPQLPYNLRVTTWRSAARGRGKKWCFSAGIRNVNADNGNGSSNGASRMVPIEEALKGRSTTFLAGRPQSPQKSNGTTNGGHSIKFIKLQYYSHHRLHGR